MQQRIKKWKPEQERQEKYLFSLLFIDGYDLDIIEIINFKFLIFQCIISDMVNEKKITKRFRIFCVAMYVE